MTDTEERPSSTGSGTSRIHQIGQGLTGSIAFLTALISHLLVPIAGFEVVYVARTGLDWIPNPIFITLFAILVITISYLVWILPGAITAYSTSASLHFFIKNDWKHAFSFALMGAFTGFLTELYILAVAIIYGTTEGYWNFLPYHPPGFEANPKISAGIWLLFLGPMSFLSFSSFSRPIRGLSAERDGNQSASNKIETRGEYSQPQTQSEPLQQANEELSFPWSPPPATTFADVGNYTDTLEDLRQSVIRPLVTTNQAYERFGVTPARGILLHGPPGTGKTHLARAIAGELGYPFIELSGGDLKSKWINESTQNVASLFREAETFEECVIFIDEIDSLLADRTDSLHQEHAQVVNEFLAQLESDAPEFIFIAATNRPDRLDAAATRRGRFDQQFEIGDPDQAGRRAILQVQLREKPMALSENDLTELAAATEGLTGADLAGMVADASRTAAEANAEAITYEHLTDALPAEAK